MPICEKCWSDAYMRACNNPMKSQAEHYHDLLEERKDHPCSKAEQKGTARSRLKKTPPVG